MDMYDVTPYLAGLLSLLALFITSWLIPMLKARTTRDQQELIQACARTVVFAAEQLFGTRRGQEKLAYATEQLQERLRKYGIKLDTSALRPYIEAAVMEFINFFDDEEIVPHEEHVVGAVGDDDEESLEGLADFIRSDDEGK